MKQILHISMYVAQVIKIIMGGGIIFHWLCKSIKKKCGFLKLDRYLPYMITACPEIKNSDYG